MSLKEPSVRKGQSADLATLGGHPSRTALILKSSESLRKVGGIKADSHPTPPWLSWENSEKGTGKKRKERNKARKKSPEGVQENLHAQAPGVDGC